MTPEKKLCKTCNTEGVLWVLAICPDCKGSGDLNNKGKLSKGYKDLLSRNTKICKLVGANNE